MKSKNVIYGLYCVCDNCKDRRERVRYVGQTSRGIRDRFSKHRWSALHGATWPVSRWMRKHGVDNIRYRILEDVGSSELLDEAEQRWIEEFDTLNHEAGGLNLWPGGASQRGYKHPQNARSRVKGPKHSEQTKRKLSEASKRNRGERGSNSKITNEVAAEVKRRLWSGETIEQVYTGMGLSIGIVSMISNGKTWTEVPWPVGPRNRLNDGKIKKGSLPPKAKLSEQDVREIRVRAASGEHPKNIATDYGVTKENISMIVTRKTWKHVE